MSNPQRGKSRLPEPELSSSARRRPGWDSADVMRAAALVIAMYLLVQLVWFAHLLLLAAFLGILFGLAVAAGVDQLQRLRIPRGAGAAIVVIGFFGILVGFGAWVAPTVHDQSIELRRRLPDAIDRVENWANSHRTGLIGLVIRGLASETTGTTTDTTAAAGAAKLATPAAPGVASDTISIEATLQKRVGRGVDGLARWLFPFVSSTFAVVTGFLIILFLAIYIAVDPDMYRRGIMHLFPYDHRDRAGEVLSAIAAVLRRWLVTQLFAMLTIGVVVTVVLLLLGVQAAMALGLLAGLLEFIPTVGPIMSALPAVAMGFLDSPEKAIWVTVAYIVIQFFENHLLIPLLMKGGMDLPPALTVFSQALMALLFGFLGLMCAVPILAATVVAVRMIYVEGVVGDRAGQMPPPIADSGPTASHASG
jgi:predicted PurR-regulated permease PerM